MGQCWPQPRWLGFAGMHPSSALVTEEDLQALDYLLWFGSGRLAAEQIGTHQSTISRRVAQVLAVFELNLQRQGGQIRLKGPHRDLLTRQRQVHQGRRLLGGLPLRLEIEATAWDRIRRVSLPNWQPCRSEQRAPGERLALLQEHVLDAWIGPLHEDLAAELTADHSEVRVLPLTLAADDKPLVLMVRAEHVEHPQIRDLVLSLSPTGSP